MNRFLRLIVFFVITFQTILIHAYAQNKMGWVNGIGATGNDVAYSIAVDSFGYVYTTGSFVGTVDFDPGPAVVNLTTPNNVSDIFITKMDSAGHLIWARSIGGGTGKAETGYGIIVDAVGNVYTTGLFNGKVDFNPSPAVADTFYLKSYGTSAFWLSPFVLKLDSAGNFLWAWCNPVNFDGTTAGGIAIDSKGDNIYSVINKNLTKLNGNGALEWTVELRNPNLSGSVPGKSVALGNGNIYVAGSVVAGGNSLCFIYKIDTAGNVVWVKAPPGATTINSITLDVYENIYATGVSGASPNKNVWVCKMDSAANVQWQRDLGNTPPTKDGDGITLDNKGNVYVTGSYIGTVDFDPGANVFDLTSANNQVNSFILKLNSQGNFVWAISNNLQNVGANIGYGIVVDNKSKAVYSAGYFKDSTFFTSATDTIRLNSALNGTNRTQDIYVSKLIQLCNSSTHLSVVACEKYNYNGQEYSTSGTYTHVFENVSGCDSVVTLKLTLNHPTDSVFTVTACQSYTLNGKIYRATGVYQQTYMNAGGCDSTVILNLIIDTVTANLTIAACNSFILNGQMYTASGTYTQQFTNVAGCDSIVKLDLTINTPPIAIATKSGNTLTADMAETYQWIDCDDRLSLSGATQKDFTPARNGNYAVIVTDKGCSDTSDCISVTLSIEDISNERIVSSHPNPTKGVVVIEFDMALYNASIKLMNMAGQTLQDDNVSGKILKIDMSSYTEGIYLLEIREHNRCSHVKLIKE